MYNVGIWLFNHTELLDFAGPFEIFSLTSELNDNELFNVFTVSQYGAVIKTVNGLKIAPDYSFGDHPAIDILIIPGGIGTTTEMNNQEALDWILENHTTALITMSVCSGARLLGKLGLLDGLEATTHHQVIRHLQEIAPQAIIRADKRFVDTGKIMTSGGISAGMDLSLYVVAKLYGEPIARKTMEYLEYGDWQAAK